MTMLNKDYQNTS